MADNVKVTVEAKNQPGKRYRCDLCGTEVLCTKGAMAGSTAAGDRRTSSGHGRCRRQIKKVETLFKAHGRFWDCGGVLRGLDLGVEKPLCPLADVSVVRTIAVAAGQDPVGAARRPAHQTQALGLGTGDPVLIPN